MVSRTRLVIAFCLLTLGLVGAVTRPVDVLSRTKPRLPFGYNGDQTSVDVRVRVLADSSCMVEGVVGDASPLDSLAIMAVTEWIFRPALRDDVPYDSTITVTVDFITPPKRSTVLSDSLGNPLDMRVLIEDRIADSGVRYHRRWERLPHYLLNENFHQRTGSHSNDLIVDNGIPVESRVVEPTYRLQTLRTFEDVSENEHTLFVDSRDYRLPPAVCETLLGLGDYSMSHVAANLRKGDLLGISNLWGRFDYIGYDGFWTDEREKASDFLCVVGYTIPDSLSSLFGSLELKTTVRSQRNEVSPISLSPWLREEQVLPVDEDIDETRVDIQRGWLEFGALNRIERYSGLTSGDCVLHTQQAWLGVSGETGDLRGNLRLLTDADDAPALLSRIEGKTWKLSQDIFAFYRDGTDYRADYRGAIPVCDSLGVFTRVSAANVRLRWRQNADDVRRFGIQPGLYYQNQGIFAELGAGPESIDKNYRDNASTELALLQNKQADVTRATGRLALNFSWQSYRLTCDVHADYRSLEVWEPRWKMDGSIGMMRDLGHQNTLGAGLRLLHQNGYTDQHGRTLNTGNSLDGWVTIDITRSFSISLEAYNLINKEVFAGEDMNLTHFNATVRWLFVN